MKSTNSRGFSLLEIVIALALTGTVALTGHRLLSVGIQSTEQLRWQQRESAFSANARRWLATSLLSLEAGEGAGAFVGLADRVEYGSWVQQPSGWLVPARVAISVRERALVAGGVTMVPLVLRDSVEAVEFDYLIEPGAETRWVRQWISPVSAPLALRLRTTTSRNGLLSVDTLLLLVKERG
jgi:prepilin-type N-terminal cleavage/methylation domain-containing protein